MMTLHPGDAERLEMLKLLADTSGNEYEYLLEQEKELTQKISAQRIDYFRKLGAYEEFRAAMAGMGVKA